MATKEGPGLAPGPSGRSVELLALERAQLPCDARVRLGRERCERRRLLGRGLPFPFPFPFPFTASSAAWTASPHMASV